MKGLACCPLGVVGVVEHPDRKGSPVMNETILDLVLLEPTRSLAGAATLAGLWRFGIRPLATGPHVPAAGSFRLHNTAYKHRTRSASTWACMKAAWSWWLQSEQQACKRGRKPCVPHGWDQKCFPAETGLGLSRMQSNASDFGESLQRDHVPSVIHSSCSTAALSILPRSTCPERCTSFTHNQPSLSPAASSVNAAARTCTCPPTPSPPPCSALPPPTAAAEAPPAPHGAR